METNGKPAPSEQRTPSRKPVSALGRADLARRVARLPIPEESRARVARFVEDEIERARSAWLAEAAPLDGLRCPKCDESIGDEVRKRRRDDAIVAVLKDSGLSPEELEKVVSESRASAERSGS